MMRFFFMIIVVSLLLAGIGPAQAGYDRQVVELAVTYQNYDAMQPWAKAKPESRRAYAVVVNDTYLLTTAQMVEYATLIKVKKFGGPKQLAASIFHIDPEINLALLTVEDQGYFEDLKSVKFVRSLPTRGNVYSVRWIKGQLEVSTSRVVRLEVLKSGVGDLKHLHLRVKSDLAGGGWSEPLFAGKRFAGLTVSADSNQANVLPAEFAEAYVEAALSGSYPGFGRLGFSWQGNQDQALSSSLGQAGEPRGVLVLEVPWGSSVYGILKSRDILLSLGGHEIDSAGFYEHHRYGRLKFPNIAVDGVFAGDSLPARILRDGMVKDIVIPLVRYKNSDRLIPGKQFSHAPPYLVAGGFVFRELNGNYLASWGQGWRYGANIPVLAMCKLHSESQTAERKRVIILSHVLPAPYNIGYHDLSNMMVQEVNGQTINSLSDLVTGFKKSWDGFHHIVFTPNGTRKDLILDAAEFKQASQNILRTYGIPAMARMPLDSE